MQHQGYKGPRSPLDAHARTERPALFHGRVPKLHAGTARTTKGGAGVQRNWPRGWGHDSPPLAVPQLDRGGRQINRTVSPECGGQDSALNPRLWRRPCTECRYVPGALGTACLDVWRLGTSADAGVVPIPGAWRWLGSRDMGPRLTVSQLGSRCRYMLDWAARLAISAYRRLAAPYRCTLLAGNGRGPLLATTVAPPASTCCAHPFSLSWHIVTTTSQDSHRWCHSPCGGEGIMTGGYNHDALPLIRLAADRTGRAKTPPCDSDPATAAAERPAAYGMPAVDFFFVRTAGSSCGTAETSSDGRSTITEPGSGSTPHPSFY